MSDENESRNNKVKVMYVRGKSDQRPEVGNPRTGKGTRPTDSRKSKDRRNEKSVVHSDSPWRTVPRQPAKPSETIVPENSTRQPVDPELIKRQRMEETRVYGENACQALFNSRPDAIVRAWFIQSVTPRFRDALRYLAANRKAYHVVEEDELVKASGTEHHGGVCFIIKKHLGISVDEWLSQSTENDCIVALDHVGNPHNLGAIMRSCAHFGAKGILVEDASLLESGAAVRTAEGGAEHVQAITADSFSEGLTRFRQAGYRIVTTSSHQGQPLSSSSLPNKVVFVLGQEGSGLDSETLNSGDMRVSIDGTGHIESLNVSVAAGILLAGWWRQRQH